MKKLLAIIPLLLLLVSNVDAATYWVRPDGILGGCVPSASAPGDASGYMSTINAGLACLSGGDTLNIRTGTYAEAIDANTINIPSGTSWLDATRIQAFDGARTVLLRPNSGGVVFNLVNTGPNPDVRYIIVDGLRFDATNVSGLAASIGGNFLHITNFDAFNANVPEFYAMQNSGSDNIISHCKLYDSGKWRTANFEGGYGLYTAGQRNLLERCEIFGNGSYGVHMFSSGETTKNDNVARYNIIHDNGKTDSNTAFGGIVVGSGSSNKVYGNIIYNENQGITVFSTCSNCEIYNNTIYNTKDPGIYHIGDADIYNNIIKNTTPGNHILVDPGATGIRLNNICDGGTGSTVSCDIVQDPLLEDAPNANFELQAGSPAIDAATVFCPSTDIAGTVRPQGAACDIGALEAVGTDPGPPAQMLVAEIACDEGTGATCADSSGNGNHATLGTGVTWATVGCKYNACIEGDGSGGLTIANSATIQTLTHGFTIEAWISANVVSGDDQALIALNPDSRIFLFANIQNFCGPNAIAAGHSQGTPAVACNTTILQAGTLTHLAAAYDQASGFVRLYRNGTHVTSVASTAIINTSDITNLTIGTSSFNEHCNCKIDSIRIYNYERTQAEIQTDMNTPINPVGDPPVVFFRVGPGGYKVGSGATFKIP